MKVGFLGRTKILYDAIEEIRKAGHDLAFIITSAEEPEYAVTRDDFKILACKFKVPFLCTEKINSKKVISWVRKYSPDIGASVNWKTIIGEEMRSCFKYGIINAHAGDLPRYKGNAAPNWAILSGEKRMTLTLHLMTRELDSGPILLKKDISIRKDTYVGDLYNFISSKTPEMFVKAINGFSHHTLRPKSQPRDPALSLRCYPRLPRDGEIAWERSSLQIERLVRASAEPFTGAYTFLNSKKMIIWKAHAEKANFSFLGVPGQVAEMRTESGEVAVLTGDGFIVLEEVEIAGRGRKKSTEIIKSLRVRLGMDICGEIAAIRDKIESLGKIKNHRKR